MTGRDLETRLRASLLARAESVTMDSLAARELDDEATPTPSALAHFEPAPRRRWVASVAALVFVVAAAATGVALRRVVTPPDTPLVTRPPVPAPAVNAAAPPRLWPLSDDAFPAPVASDRLATPEAAARAYLTDVVGLPADWTVGEAVAGATPGRATVPYVLQDVPSTVDVAQHSNGLWFVTSASTDQVRPSVGALDASSIQIAVGPGPRTPSSGVDVRFRAIAVDGRVLGTADARAAASPASVSLHLDDPRERPAAVRGDVLDDVDGDPSTPPVIVGHWAVAIPMPASLALLPAGVDVESVAPVFGAEGSVDDVASAYLRSRFPDFPAPGVKIEQATTRGRLAFASWAVEEDLAKGTVVLREIDGGWTVVAAITDGVDLSNLRRGSDDLLGTVTTDNPNSLFADVLQADGEPVPGAPRPQGQPDAAYRFGTAGGPADHRLAVEVAVPVVAPVVVRVSLVGGTILSISEVTMGAG